METVATALQPHLPPPVEAVLVRERPRGGLVVRATAAGDDLGHLFDLVRTTHGVDERGLPTLGVHGETPTFLGTWLPLPRGSVLARINAQSATEAVQAAVEERLGSPWPYADAAVRTRLVGATVRVWFHDGRGGRVTMAFSVPVAACLPA